MPIYRIQGSVSGRVYGECQAPTAEAAFDACTRDMGYADWYDMWCMVYSPFLELIWATSIDPLHP